MGVEKTIKDVYVDIDSIMDTRLPILYYIDETLAIDVIMKGLYHNRYIDEFKYVTKDIFDAIYKERNKTLLSYATPTNVLKLISQYYNEVNTSNKLLTDEETINIYLNTYPYELNIVETHNMVKGMTTLLSGNIKITIINMKHSELTPAWINKHVASMFMYDALEWLELHTSNFNLINNPLLEVGIVAPALLSSNKHMLKNIDNIDIFFSDLEKSVSSLAKLRVVPASDFSVIKK